MEERGRMRAKEKMMILQELLENKVQIGELSEKYQIHPNLIYNLPAAGRLEENIV